jgi:hydrogenase/urease accessory protein HupE
MKGKTRLDGQAGCYGSLAAVFLLLWPAGADAHLVSTGFGPFYDGVTHLAVSPDDLLSVLAIALLSGLCGARHVRAVLFTLPTAWVVAGWLGLQRATEVSVPVANTLSFMVVGALVAVDLKVPWPLIVGLAVALGLFHGFLNGTAIAQGGGGVTALLGTSAAVFVVVALVAGFVVALRAAWARVAVRVAGSWITAIGLLMLGWAFRA